MLTFDNTHIFTGYIKQLLADFNLPRCKIYTPEYEYYAQLHGVEDPRVVETVDPICITATSSQASTRPAANVVYLKNGDFYRYYWPTIPCAEKTEFISKNLIPSTTIFNSKVEKTIKLRQPPVWRKVLNTSFTENIRIPGVTTQYKTTANSYTSDMHEYLGEYLRFKRDYSNLNLMSMYNCYSNRLCNNIKLQTTLADGSLFELNSYDTRYKIYMIPVKLFENYTIAIDCAQGVELACVLYNKNIISSPDLIVKTYQKIPATHFHKPFLFDKLDVKYWNLQEELRNIDSDDARFKSILEDATATSRWDILQQEQNLKLLIKVPATCTSSVVVLEGDYRTYNDTSYIPTYTYSDGTSLVGTESIVSDCEYNGSPDSVKAPGNTSVLAIHWKYSQNSLIPNFESITSKTPLTLAQAFKPISKLQLLAVNSGVSYPFADRLMEYLTGNAITSEETLSDNIKRLQTMQASAGYIPKHEGLWELTNQMLVYDYLLNDGPYVTKNTKKSTSMVSRPAETALSVCMPYWSESIKLQVQTENENPLVYSCPEYKWYFNPDAPKVLDPTVTKDAYDGLHLLIFNSVGYQAFDKLFKPSKYYYETFYIIRISATGEVLGTYGRAPKFAIYDISEDQLTDIKAGLKGSDIVVVLTPYTPEDFTVARTFRDTVETKIKMPLQISFGRDGNYKDYLKETDINLREGSFTDLDAAEADGEASYFSGKIYARVSKRGVLTVRGRANETSYHLRRVKETEDGKYQVIADLGIISREVYSYVAQEDVILQITPTGTQAPIQTKLNKLTLKYPAPTANLTGVQFQSGSLSITYPGIPTIIQAEGTWTFSEYSKSVLADLGKIDVLLYNKEDVPYIPQDVPFGNGGYAVIVGASGGSTKADVRRIYHENPSNHKITKWVSRGGQFHYSNTERKEQYFRIALSGLAADEIVFICPARADGTIPEIHNFLQAFTQKVRWETEAPEFGLFGVVLGRETTIVTEIENQRRGVHPAVGHTQRSAQFDVLGFVDKDAEKFYATWERQATVGSDGLTYIRPKIKETLSSIDIYNGLYD